MGSMWADTKVDLMAAMSVVCWAEWKAGQKAELRVDVTVAAKAAQLAARWAAATVDKLDQPMAVQRVVRMVALSVESWVDMWASWTVGKLAAWRAVSKVDRRDCLKAACWVGEKVVLWVALMAV